MVSRMVQLCNLLQLLLAGSLGQSPDLEGLRGLDEGGKHMLRDISLALVHIFDKRLEVLEIHIFHHDHGMLVVEEGGFEQRLKERKIYNLLFFNLRYALRIEQRPS